MPKQVPPRKDWCFTLNNPRQREYAKLKAAAYQYIVFQLEVGENGTPHLQGFIQMQDKVRLSSMKKLLRRAHWEPRRGTAAQAAHYCIKPVAGCDCKHCVDVPRVYPQLIFEDGLLSSSATESLEVVCESIKKNGLSKTINAYPMSYVRMKNGMEGLATFYSPKRDWETQVTVCYGEPGTGKTRYAMLSPSPYKLAAFGGKDSTDFFGDYHPDEHETLVVDDFYGNWKYTTWLQVCDRYPTEVHTKGGFRQLLVRHCVFTSNNSPSEWYPNVLADPNRRESFNRRIHNIIHFTKLGFTVIKV